MSPWQWPTVLARVSAFVKCVTLAQGSGSRRMGSGLVGSTSRDLSAAVKSALDELVKVTTDRLPSFRTAL